MTAQGRPPVFIVGCKRSGTTLLSRVVDMHPAFAIYHESFLYPIFHPELRWYGDLTRHQNLARLVADIRTVVARQVPDVPPTEEILQTVTRPDLSGVFGALLGLHARRHGASRGGDKTPEHHAWLEEILEGFPGAPILFLLRDPRDTVHSILRVFGGSVAGAAWAWRRAWEGFCRHQHRVHPVRYEDLARSPRKTVHSVCGALSEPFAEAMLEHHQKVPAYYGLLGGEKLASPIDAGAIGRYRDLRAHDIRLIETICGEGMEMLGYDRAGPPSSGTPRGINPPGRPTHLLDRVRYYGLKPRRWRRGWVRWRVMLTARLRYVLRWGTP